MPGAVALLRAECICHIDARTRKARIFKPRPIPLRASVARVSIATRRRKAGQASRA